MMADQVAHVAHLNARDTTLVFVSRASQADIARLKARMGWKMPWYTITDGFDADFGVDEWHGTNVFFRDGDRDLPHVLRRAIAATRRWEVRGVTLTLPRSDARKTGKTRRPATRRPHPTRGGTGTMRTRCPQDGEWSEVVEAAQEILNVILIAHIMGMPVEEVLVPLASGAGTGAAFWLAAFASACRSAASSDDARTADVTTEIPRARCCRR